MLELMIFSPLFVSWKKSVNGEEPSLRGCIGTLQARHLISGFKDYALTRYSRVYGIPIADVYCAHLQLTITIAINEY